MRNIPEYNFPRFHEMAAHLRDQGYEISSPAEHDLEMGFNPSKGDLEGFDLEAAFRWDFEQIMKADGIFLLQGWEHSEGACAEESVARLSGKKIYFERLDPLVPYSEEGFEWYTKQQNDAVLDAAIAASGLLTPDREVRITDPVTGGQKGAKLAELGALDPMALWQIAEVAGFGSRKYSRGNFLLGYRWSLSFDAMMRHLLLFWTGEDLDAESGLSHLAHAGWHVMALLAFADRGLGTDDRYAPKHPPVVESPS
jgi:hypothetical protein